MEAMLSSLLCILQRCPLSTGDRMAEFCQKLCTILSLEEKQLSEKSRILVSQMLCEIFSEQNILYKPDNYDWLEQELYAPVVGLIISTLLDHPYNQVNEARKISPAVQKWSLNALKSFILAVNNASALAYFLPGTVTGLVKRIMEGRIKSLEGDKIYSKHSSSIATSIETVNVLLSIVFNDEVISKLHSNSNDQGVQTKEAIDSNSMTAKVREMLSTLSVKREKIPKAINAKEEEFMMSSDRTRLRVDMTEAWVKGSSRRVTDMLKISLPSLCFHNASSVRKSLLELAIMVLDECSKSFVDNQFLIDIVIVLAQDTWLQIREKALLWLKKRARMTEHSSKILNDDFSAKMMEDLHDVFYELPEALKKGDLPGRRIALKLCSLIECHSPKQIVSNLIIASELTDELVQCLSSCLEIDQSAGILRNNTSAPAQIVAVQSILDSEMYDGSANLMKRSIMGTDLGVPKYPECLRNVSTRETYDIMSKAFRLLGRNAILSDVEENSKETAFIGLSNAIFRQIEQNIELMGPKAQKRRKRRKAQELDLQHGDQIPELQIAQYILLLQEFFYGASSVWTEKSRLDVVDPNILKVTDLCIEKAMKLVKTSALQGFQTLLDQNIWLLNSSDIVILNTSTRNAAKKDVYNGLIQQYAMEYVAVVARTLGIAFLDGELLHIVLLPLIEKLSSNSDYLSLSSKGALLCICESCGYDEGLSQLCRANIDYIIDGMCMRLRRPATFPSAPELFAALLKETGVARSLLPLLAEPASHAIRGISILQRKEKPEHVLSFVKCILEIGKGASSVSEHSMKILTEISDVVNRVLEENLSADDDDAIERSDNVTIEEISGFFKRRMHNQNSESSSKVQVPLETWNRLIKARREALACAKLTQAAADAVNPLLLSESLTVSVQSLKATLANLCGLNISHECLDMFKKKLENQIECPGEFSTRTKSSTNIFALSPPHVATFDEDIRRLENCSNRVFTFSFSGYNAPCTTISIQKIPGRGLAQGKTPT